MNLNHKTLYFRKKCFEIKVDVYEIVLFGMSDLDKVTVVYFYMLGLSCSGHCFQVSNVAHGPLFCLNLALV